MLFRHDPKAMKLYDEVRNAKNEAETRRVLSVEEQFQIGDRVIYLPENVLARVTSYLWSHQVAAPSRIIAYELDVGIHASFEQLKRASITK